MSDLSSPPLSSMQPPAGATGAQPTEPIDAKALAGAAFAWPTPPDGAYPVPTRQTAPEPCEIESRQGKISTGTLMAFNADAGVALVRLVNGRRTLTLRFNQFRRLTLLKPLTPLPSAPDKTTPLLPQRGLSRCRLQYIDGPEVLVTSVGHVELAIGVFTFTPLDENGQVERSFYPRAHLQKAELGLRQTDLAAPERADAPAPAAPVASVVVNQPTAPRTATRRVPPPTPPVLTVAVTPSQLPPMRPLPPVMQKPSAPAMAKADAVVDQPPSPTPTAPASPKALPAARGTGDLSLAPLATAAEPPTAMAATAAMAGPARAATAPTAPATAPAVPPEPVNTEPIATAEQLLAAIERQARMPMVRIGEALLALGFITEQKLGDALQAQSRDRSLPLGELLVRRGDVTRAQLETALARKMGYPVVDLQGFPVEHDAALRVPLALARRLGALPLILRAGRLVVALEDPSARHAIDEIEFSAQCKVVSVLASAGTLAQAIERVYLSLGKEAIEPSEDLLAAMNSRGDDDGLHSADSLVATLEQSLAGDEQGDAPVIEQSDNSLVRLINTMILEARQQGVSDIHIECQPGHDKVRVRFRQDGVLRPYIVLPHTYRQAMVARIKIMCDLDISEKRKPQDGKINFGRWVQGQRLELRVATIPTSNGLEDVVLRLLASARTLPLQAMGLQPDTLTKFTSVIERPYGMVLCVGPTGSGKTTTLHAALGHINTPERKIWTAEDPVEITQAGLRQVQVNPKIDWTFAKALRAFLRADPDVVMVGEIRDAETAQMAIEASLTGHLVMSTLHTNSAPETVTRLLDMGMDPFSFADSLLAVLAQRLVRRWCKHCVTSQPASLEETDALLDEYLQAYPDPAQRPDRQALLADWQQRHGLDGVLQHHHAPGCSHCGNSGYSGRLGLHELLMVSRDMRHLIQTKTRATELQRQAMSEGMRTLRQDGIDKVLAGLTSIEEVRATSNG